MKLKETVYLSLAAVAVVIGIHRTMQEESVAEGVALNYWIFMAGIVFLFLYRYETQKKRAAEQKQEPTKPKPPRPAAKKRPQRK